MKVLNVLLKYHEIRWLQEVVVLLFICLYFRNVYEILTQKEGTNQYEACLMKGNANFTHYFGDIYFQIFFFQKEIIKFNYRAALEIRNC